MDAHPVCRAAPGSLRLADAGSGSRGPRSGAFGTRWWTDTTARVSGVSPPGASAVWRPGAGRPAGRRVQVRAARPLNRPGAGAAVPASGPGREQHPVFGSRGARRAVGPRPALSRGDDPPALPRPVSVHGHGIPGPKPSGIQSCTAAPCTGPRAGTARTPPGARPRQRRLHRPAWKTEADAGAAPAPRRPPPSGAPRPCHWPTDVTSASGMRTITRGPTCRGNGHRKPRGFRFAQPCLPDFFA